MTAVLAGAAVPMVGVAIVLAAAALLATGKVSVALPVLLDLLFVAGLLRLSATGTWEAIATTAVVIALRRLAAMSIAARHRSRPDHVRQPDSLVAD